jgi:hypothetical protein
MDLQLYAPEGLTPGQWMTLATMLPVSTLKSSGVTVSTRLRGYGKQGGMQQTEWQSLSGNETTESG